MRRLAFALLAAGALGQASCVQLTWRNARVGLPLAAERIDWALAAEPDLGTALAELGAPHIVRNAEDRGVELLWVWRRSAAYGAGLSVPISDVANASFQWDESDASARGLRLHFDTDGRFVEGSRGAVFAQFLADD